jgi:hypothetical protein
MGLCLVELLTLTMKIVPFACMYLPGQLKLRIYWAPLFFLWLNSVFTLANWCLWAFDSVRHLAQLSVFLTALWVVLRALHMRTIRGLRFVFDEQPDVRLSSTNISGITRQA